MPPAPSPALGAATRTVRLTRDGWIAGVAGAALLIVGLASGNNLLYLVAAPLWAALLLALPLGWFNLRGLEVRRMLPAELYAGRDAAGRLLLRNPRRRLSASAIEVTDEGTGAVGACARAPAGQVVPIGVRWRFGERGRVRLVAVTVRSTWPFGFAEHAVRVPLVAGLVVYPRPLPATAQPTSRDRLGHEEDLHGHGTGDFLGLRPYREGDPPRTVHWPTTARAGAPYVVDRAGETEVSVEVEVRVASGAAWEREISRACGEVHKALQLGRKVGLALPAVGDRPGRRLPASMGGAWRRTLLEQLALLPRIER